MRTISEAKDIYNKKIEEDEQAQIKADLERNAVILKREAIEKDLEEKKRLKKEKHDNEVANLNPANLLMDLIVDTIENVKGQEIILDQITRTGQSDNIYLYGFDNWFPLGKHISGIYNFQKMIFNETTKEFEHKCIPNSITHEDIAKNFINCGTIKKPIKVGEFAGYNLVGYGRRQWIWRSHVFYINLKKPYWKRLSGNNFNWFQKKKWDRDLF